MQLLRQFLQCDHRPICTRLLLLLEEHPLHDGLVLGKQLLLFCVCGCRLHSTSQAASTSTRQRSAGEQVSCSMRHMRCMLQHAGNM